MKLRIKEILKIKGITVISLAESVGITQPNMSNIVNGKTNPSLETLQKIAGILNIEMWEFFTERIAGDLNAIVDHKGKSYVATTIAELESIISELKEDKNS